MRLGVLTGGGDVPGLNPCIQAIVQQAAGRGWSVVGFKAGWQGPLNLNPAMLDSAWMVELTPERVRGIDREGGTILHTSRTDPRHVKPADLADFVTGTEDGDRPGTRDATAHVLKVLNAAGIDAMITLGGDGTLRFSAHLSNLGVPVISIPKTMDNDVFGTDTCIGFSTAVTRSVEHINALRTTAASHQRIAVVELFGRRSGETALLSGFLAQADRTVISESPVVTADLVNLLVEDRAANPDKYAVCVVSEGAGIDGGGLGDGISTPHLMRSGAPDALDRMVAMAFGQLAVRLIETKRTGMMTAIRDGNYDAVPADTITKGVKRVDVDALYDPRAYRAKLRDILGLPMFLY
jgi:ATP-dependent phosphofructokinase / diphosphate-dependent phosphofructokinase